MAVAATRNRWLALGPNLLTALRVALALTFPLVPPDWRLAVVLAAGLSDWLDGLLARKLGVASLTGQILDAIADKLFVLFVAVTLTVAGDIAWWQLLLVLSRDLAVAYVSAHYAVKRRWDAFRGMLPRLLGKTATVILIVWFVTLLLPWSWVVVARGPAFVVGAVFSVLAALDYLAVFAQVIRKER